MNRPLYTERQLGTGPGKTSLAFVQFQPELDGGSSGFSSIGSAKAVSDNLSRPPEWLSVYTCVRNTGPS